MITQFNVFSNKILKRANFFFTGMAYTWVNNVRMPSAIAYPIRCICIEP